MADFLLELRSEEIPARMQAKARNDLARLFAECTSEAGLSTGAIETFSTPRRLTLIAHEVAEATEAVREEIKGPRTSAPPQALEGFLRKTGLAREQLEERDGVYFAVVERAGRSAAEILGEVVKRIISDFPWPKSMRWGPRSLSSASLRWVRPLHGIVAILGEEIVPVEVDGISSGASTVGHRFHHPGAITVGGASDYAEKLRACHVIVDQDERERIIREGAAAAAAEPGLQLIEDEGLVVENAGLTEWPVPLLGRFDEDFLDVPREVIVLTMRTNQKYFACAASDGGLAPAFVCVANVAASDGGKAIVEGNARVLAARLADARFFWEQDLKVPLEEQAAKLSGIIFHEKLGTVADKVERVAKLARWLVEQGIVKPSPLEGEGGAAAPGEGATARGSTPSHPSAAVQRVPPSPSGGEGVSLADLAERAARLAKADLVTGMVGEFPELQGVIGGYLAAAQGEPAAVADAIRDHYRPVGQGDEAPTAPVTVAVSLADKLDSLGAFFGVSEEPTGSKDPFALRRAALGAIRLIQTNELRLSFVELFAAFLERWLDSSYESGLFPVRLELDVTRLDAEEIAYRAYPISSPENYEGKFDNELFAALRQPLSPGTSLRAAELLPILTYFLPQPVIFPENLIYFFADRLKVQQREAGVRHDLIDAVFALGGEDDLVRLLARVNALQKFVETEEGADLLTAYKRAANILKKEKWVGPQVMSSAEEQGIPQTGEEDPLVLVDDPILGEAIAEMASGEAGADLPQEKALIAALDAAEPKAAAAVQAEDFTSAMAALATLRKPIDDFFDHVTVNDPDSAKRERRLNLLMRFRDAVNQVADFSKIEG
jgi:glycyl-tRNA synthetase beta chain